MAKVNNQIIKSKEKKKFVLIEESIVDKTYNGYNIVGKKVQYGKTYIIFRNDDKLRIEIPTKHFDEIR